MGRTLPLTSEFDHEFGDEPATELMEMPSEGPVALVEIGAADLEPAAVLAESAGGARDLYVALTRPTRRVVVLHAEPLPAGMPAGH